MEGLKLLPWAEGSVTVTTSCQGSSWGRSHAMGTGTGGGWLGSPGKAVSDVPAAFPTPQTLGTWAGDPIQELLVWELLELLELGLEIELVLELE